MSWEIRIANLRSAYEEMMQRIQAITEEESLMYQVAMQRNNEVFWLKSAELEIAQKTLDTLNEIGELQWGAILQNASNLSDQLVIKLSELVTGLVEGRREYIEYKQYMVIGSQVEKLSSEQIDHLAQSFRQELDKLNNQYVNLFMHFAFSGYSLEAACSELRAQVKDIENTSDDLQLRITGINEAMLKNVERRHDQYSQAAQSRSELQKSLPDIELIQACRSGDLGVIHNAVKKLKSSFISNLTQQSPRKAFLNRVIDTGDGVTETLLHAASEAGHTHLVIYLLTRGADPRIKNSQGYLPLHYAARGGHSAVVSALLDVAPETVDAQAAEGRTPLDEAAYHGQVAAAQTLIQCRADLELKTTKDNQTPLQKAVWQGWRPEAEKVVALLVDAGADVSVMTEIRKGFGSELKSVNLLQVASLEGHEAILNFFLKRRVFKIDETLAEQMLQKAVDAKRPDIAEIWARELLKMKSEAGEEELATELSVHSKMLNETVRKDIDAAIEKFKRDYTETALTQMGEQLDRYSKDQREKHLGEITDYRERVFSRVAQAKPEHENTVLSASASSEQGTAEQHYARSPSSLAMAVPRSDANDDPDSVEMGSLAEHHYGKTPSAAPSAESSHYASLTQLSRAPDRLMAGGSSQPHADDANDEAVSEKNAEASNHSGFANG